MRGKNIVSDIKKITWFAATFLLFIISSYLENFLYNAAVIYKNLHEHEYNWIAVYSNVSRICSYLFASLALLSLPFPKKIAKCSLIVIKEIAKMNMNSFSYIFFAQTSLAMFKTNNYLPSMLRPYFGLFSVVMMTLGVISVEIPNYFPEKKSILFIFRFILIFSFYMFFLVV